MTKRTNFSQHCLFVDSHVHLHPGFPAERVLNTAANNFKKYAQRLKMGEDFSGILLLTEIPPIFRFEEVASFANREEKSGSWDVFKTEEKNSILCKNAGGFSLYLIAGRQFVSAEKLEVLGYGISENIGNDLPLREIISKITERQGVACIPWGFGKWWGERGKLLSDFLEQNKDLNFYLGDNGGRPRLVKNPDIFSLGRKKNIRILPGSDPLPLKNEVKRIGSFGFYFSAEFSPVLPFQSLHNFLQQPDGVLSVFGHLENPVKFIYKQLRIRMK